MPLTSDVTIRRKSTKRADALEARLQAIVDAAADLFGTHGYNATPLREVAKRAGISPAGLMHHFPEKAALLEAVLDDRLGSINTRFGLQTDDGEAFLRGLVAATEQDAADPTDLRLFTMLSCESLDPQHPAHGYFQRWYARVRELVQHAFEDLQQRGLYVSRLTPEEAAIQFAASRDGMNLHWFTSDQTIDLVSSIKKCLQMYVDVDLSGAGAPRRRP